MAPLPSLGDTVGVVMITGMLVAALYGITTVQTFIYYQHNKHDPTMLKHSFIFMIHVVYYYGALTVGNLEKLVTMPWSIPAYVIVAGVSDVMVLGWYAHRLWKLSASKWLILIIATGAFTVLVGASYLAALLSKYPDIPTFNKKGGESLLYGHDFLRMLINVSHSGPGILSLDPKHFRKFLSQFS
ncbi:hypothetical protein BDW22DRAFT_436478 [Trametopsis cervina]|nr:hypothetical protein BDW22DRAFT_436478 [Trametopsis cervina]